MTAAATTDSRSPKSSPAELGTSVLRIGDVIRVGSSGLRSRKLRTGLSALGISIGIAAMVGVLGLSESSRAELRAEIQSLGTNLLAVAPGEGFGAGDGVMPVDATEKIARVGPVQETTSTVPTDAVILRNEFVNPAETGGVTVVGADPQLLSTLNGEVADGVFLDDLSADLPHVVLGAVAAERLGVVEIGDGVQLLVGDEWFTVVGILEPFPLAPDLDRSAIVGQAAAATFLDAEPNPGTVYVRTDPGAIDAVRAVLAATADPESPEEVEVSRPSEALEAEAAADDAFTRLFLGLGGVALIVGGIGIANVMVIAVIERRNEIGLRRALGATQAHIRRQFLAEALVLSALGGAAGVLIGSVATAVYATSQGWQVVIPAVAAVGGFLAALAIGVVAGLYPAVRAARLAPTDALRST